MDDGIQKTIQKNNEMVKDIISEPQQMCSETTAILHTYYR